jgi:hypothetical protein
MIVAQDTVSSFSFYNMTNDLYLICAFQDIKGCTIFKLKGLQNEEQLSIMFEDLRNTGDDHWSASSGHLLRHTSPFPLMMKIN